MVVVTRKGNSTGNWKKKPCKHWA